MTRERQWGACDPLAPTNPLLPCPVVKALPPLLAEPDCALVALQPAHSPGHDGAGGAVEDPGLGRLERGTALGHAAARVIRVGDVSRVTHALVTALRVDAALVTRSGLRCALVQVLTPAPAPRHQGVARAAGAAVGARGVGAHLGAGSVLITLVNVHTPVPVVPVAWAALTRVPRVSLVTVTSERVTGDATLAPPPASLRRTDRGTLVTCAPLPLPTGSRDALPGPLLLARAALLGDAGEGAGRVDTLTLFTH